jgi:nitrogen fixation/metabolism regulation signal transduction histidine kinase
MFKSIQYKLYAYIALLTVAAAVATGAFLVHGYIYAFAGMAVITFCLFGLNDCYRRYNSNILFLLNALDNGDYSFHFSETKLSVREKEMNRMLNHIKDILTNARKEVIENEQFLSLILDRVSTGIVLVDDRGIVRTVNRAALNLLGLPVFSHLNQLHTINETYPERFHRLRAGDNLQLSLATEREELQISLHVSLIKLKRGTMRILTLNNIGNELEMKEMESWIHLIRVMTHEIMNSIAPITSLSETMRSLYQSDTDVQEFKQSTLEVFETISATAAGLLSFVESYRKFTAVPQPKKETFDLRMLIEKVLLLHEPVLAEKAIAVVVRLPDPLLVWADENLLMQVLINLVKNAVEAVEPHRKGQIILSAPPLDVDHTLLLDIANTGRPIPADVLPYIFTPFFTTKPSGSGIGLSVSRYIMRLHGGKLQHTVSKEGMTVFQIVLPVVERG